MLFNRDERWLLLHKYLHFHNAIAVERIAHLKMRSEDELEYTVMVTKDSDGWHAHQTCMISVCFFANTSGVRKV